MPAEVNVDYADAMKSSLRYVESEEPGKIRELHADNYQRRMEAETEVADLKTEVCHALALIETLKTSLAEAEQTTDSLVNDAGTIQDKNLCLQHELEETLDANDSLNDSLQLGHEMNQQLMMGLNAATSMSIVAEGRIEELQRHLSDAMDTINHG